MEIRQNDLLLGRYRILDAPIVCGSTAKVWRILHTEWGRELALKQPLDQYLANADSRRGYLEECSLWISLGLHPYIVTCYYVREIDGIPMIFCEWCGGRSLEDCLADKSLFCADEKPLHRLLRIAGQIMIALCYTHSFSGLIHGDIKPANIMLSENGTAKLTDFGSAGPVKSFTPNYMSPEQYALLEYGEVELTPATDVYSWALIVLEMLAGERCWTLGSEAAADPDELVRRIFQALPPEFAHDADASTLRSLRELLAECLDREPRRRPQDTEIAETLYSMLRHEDGSLGALDRSLTDHAFETADSLNNRAISHYDLGETAKAETCWKRALKLMPMHPEAVYGQSVYQWECGWISDTELRRRVSQICLPQRAQFWKELDQIRRFVPLFTMTAADTPDECVIESIRFSKDSRSLLIVLSYPDGRYGVVLRDTETGEVIRDTALKDSDFPEKDYLSAWIDGEQIALISEGEPFGSYYAVQAETGGRKRALGEFRYLTFSPDGRLAAAIETDSESISLFRTTPPGRVGFFLSKVGSAEKLAAQYAQADRIRTELTKTTSLPRKLTLLEALSGLGSIGEETYFAEKAKLFPLCRRSNFRVGGLTVNHWTGAIERMYCSPGGEFALLVPENSGWTHKLELIELPTCRTIKRFLYHSPFAAQFHSAAFDGEETLTIWSVRTDDAASSYTCSVFELHTLKCIFRNEPCDAPAQSDASQLPPSIRSFCVENGFKCSFCDDALTRLIAVQQDGNLCIYHIDCDLTPR